MAARTWFVHIRPRAAGISQLPEGQAVIMKVVDTQKGREAVASNSPEFFADG